MFKNPGKSIKNLANIVFWIVLIGAFIAFFYVLFMQPYPDSIANPIIACGWLLGGIASAYIAGLLLYGFGQLIDSAESIESNSSILTKKLENQIESLSDDALNLNEDK